MKPQPRTPGSFRARLAFLALCGTVALAGCARPPAVARLAEPEPIATAAATPPDAAPGSCWGRETTPAETTTVVEPVLVQPAQLTSSGEVLSPPIYRREPQQRIVKPGRQIWFETPCPAELTPEYVSTLQRALAARGLYKGAVTGRMDQATRRAIRRYQAPQGLDSGTFSLAAARRLGLAPALLPPPAE